jgi:VWFA-related protein
VDVRVTDSQGRVIRDLTREDFTILEDGRPQAIASFSLVDLDVDSPVTPVAPDIVEGDVATNASGGRMWVLLLGGVGEQARFPARRFIQHSLGPLDEVAVVHLHGTMSGAQGFTSNRRLLLAAIDRLPDTLPVRLDADNIAYRVLEDLCLRLGQTGGRRKAVIFFDPPKFFAPAGPSGDPGEQLVWFDQRDAIRAATRNNVAIYVVSTEGLKTESSSPLRVPLVADTLKDMAGQRVLAEETGGDSIVNSNDYDRGFERFVRDTSAFYLLGYVPAVEHRDGEFHRLSVRVNRPGVTVRARRGYYAPDAQPRLRPDRAGSPKPGGLGGLSAGAWEALRLPFAVNNGVRVDLAATPFRGTGQQASVLLAAQIAGRDLALETGEPLEVGFQANTTEGRTTPGSFHVFELNLAASRDATATHGLRFLDRVKLLPGRHQVRLVAHQPSGRTGMVVADMEVPDFSKRPLSLSGVSLASNRTALHPTLRGDEVSRQALGAEPTAARRFSQGDVVTAFVEAYTDTPARQSDLRVRATIAPLTSRRRVRALEVKQVLEERSRTGYVIRVQLTDLAAGDYVLTFEARASRLKATRQVLVTVAAD